LRQSAREVHEAARIRLTHLREVDDHWDPVAEALRDDLGVFVLARVHRKNFVHLHGGSIPGVGGATQRGHGRTISGGLGNRLRDRRNGCGRRGILVLELFICQTQVNHGLAQRVSHLLASCGGTAHSRLTGRRSLSGDCRANPEVCRALEDRLAEIRRHAGGDEGRLRCDRGDAFGCAAHPREGASRFFIERRDRHDPEQAQAGRLDDALRHGLEVCILHSTPAWVVGEIQLHEAVDRTVRRGEGVDQRGSIDRVDDRGIVPRLASLLALQLADEMPVELEVGQLRGLGRGLLVAVLAEVTHPERVQAPHELRRVELGHHDRRDRGSIPPCFPGGLGDGLLHAAQPRREVTVVRHLPPPECRYLRKSGTSRSSSSSPKTGSLCEEGSSGSACQRVLLGRAASSAASTSGARSVSAPSGASTKLERWPAFLTTGSPPSKPAAITVTRTSSPRVSSMTAPKIMFASGCTASCTRRAASLISKIPRLDPPWIESSTPCAPSMLASSRGDATASSAALIARSAPRDEPMPMRAEPAPCMTDLTSAKSRLMRPGVVMRSVMPCTPARSTWSAVANASRKLMPRSLISSRRSLGTTIRVSTSLFSAETPTSAWAALRLPSKPKGRVTTPMVSAPMDLAMRATTGAPPVPVPPPSPAVTKTMSAPASASSISSAWSSAARRPTSGSAPAPSPRVSSRPTSSLTSASLISSAWASVLMAMNSTPRSPSSIMRLTALTPPPPTPTTFITARYPDGWAVAAIRAFIFTTPMVGRLAR